jgi:CO/xanthine dehydrogenase Mo-binding subunit
MDAVELRLRNALREGSLLTTQTPVNPGVTIVEVIERCAAEAGWGAATPAAADGRAAFSGFQTLRGRPQALRRGRGFACALKNIGFSFGAPERCEATIELRGGAEVERAVLRHAGADVGQGAHTVFQQMAAEALGLPVERVELDVSDTASSGNSGSASASRLTWMSGNAIRGAAELARAAWQNEERPAIGHFRFVPPATTPYEPETGRSLPNFSYGYVAQVVDVAVDVETGHVHLERVISTHDVGKALNPNLIEGQIEGAVVQAAGYAVMEDLRLKDGRILNPTFSTYLIPGILDIPDEVRSVIMELPDPLGPWGARGMAEMPFMPLAPAVAAALHDATGAWFDELPLTPERVLQVLAAQGAK